MRDVDQRIFEARYDVSSAAHHLRMARSTLVSWTQGMGAFKPVLEPPQPGYLSFVNLTEAFVLLAMRRYRIKMPHIRRAIEYVEQSLGVEHPLAFQWFGTDQVHLFVDTAAGVVNASLCGQTRMNDVLQTLDRIEWQNERPIALFPVSRHADAEERPIRLSPLIAFGRPVLTGTRIPTRTVFDRFYGGESVRELAEDYGVSTEAIEEAVRAESEPTAA